MAFVFWGILCVVTGLPVLKKFFIFLFSLLWSYLTFKNYLNDSFLCFLRYSVMMAFQTTLLYIYDF